MAVSPSLALQATLVATLRADTALVGILGGPKIYDHPPRETLFPYVVIAESLRRDWSTASEGGTEHVVTFHTWSRERGKKESYAIVQAIIDVLHDANLTLTDHRLINLRHETTGVRRDPGGEEYHGVVRLRAVTEPI